MFGVEQKVIKRELKSTTDEDKLLHSQRVLERKSATVHRAGERDRKKILTLNVAALKRYCKAEKSAREKETRSSR